MDKVDSPQAPPPENPPAPQQPVESSIKPPCCFPCPKPFTCLLIAVLFIFAIAAGGYYLLVTTRVALVVLNQQPPVTPMPTPTPDPIVNRKTYTNKTLGISFSYPREFIIRETSNVISFYSTENNNDSLFTLILYKNPNNLSLKDYESQNTGESGMGPNVYYPDSELVMFETIGRTYYERKEVSCFSKCGSYVWTYKDTIYKLTGSTRSDFDQKKIMDQILSAFRFLDQEQALDMTGWKTYISMEGKYTLKYPGNHELYENIYPPVIITKSTQIKPSSYPVKNTTFLRLTRIPETGRTFFMSIEYDFFDVKKSLEEVVKKSCEYISGAESQPFTLGSKEAVIFIDGKCAQSAGTVIYAVNGNYGYSISVEYTSGLDSYDELKKYAEQILSTFRFLD